MVHFHNNIIMHVDHAVPQCQTKLRLEVTGQKCMLTFVSFTIG